MADNKQDNPQQQAPRAGDRLAMGGSDPRVQNDANKSNVTQAPDGSGAEGPNADKSSPKTGGQGTDGPVNKADETVPGGAYIVDGRVLDANGNERKDYKVQDGKIVKA